MRLRVCMCGVFAVAVVMTAAGAAHAASITFGLDIAFSGTAPSGSTPWVTANFDDSFGGTDTVRLTMSAVNLMGIDNDAEYIKGMYFNFDPALDPTQLGFTVVDNIASVPMSILTGVNNFRANGDGDFDILVDFPPEPGNPPERFTGGEIVIYDITYTSAINANSFNFFSDMGGGQGTFLVAAQIQGIGASDESGFIGVVPEPNTAALLGLGLAGLGLLRRRRS